MEKRFTTFKLMFYFNIVIMVLIFIFTVIVTFKLINNPEIIGEYIGRILDGINKTN